MNELLIKMCIIFVFVTICILWCAKLSSNHSLHQNLTQVHKNLPVPNA